MTFIYERPTKLWYETEEYIYEFNNPSVTLACGSNSGYTLEARAWNVVVTKKAVPKKLKKSKKKSKKATSK